jgi:hypothetical protein
VFFTTCAAPAESFNNVVNPVVAFSTTAPDSTTFFVNAAIPATPKAILQQHLGI